MSAVYQQSVHKIFKSNPLAWGYYYFPNHFPQESPAFHLKILKAIMGHKKVAICAPRGSSKSTIANFLFLTHSIVFNRFRHIILLQANLDKAMSSLQTIKTEFTDNPRLKDTYRIRMPLNTQEETEFKHPNGFTTLVKCFGREQMGKVRGSKYGAWRPDAVVVDDLEDDELVRTKDLREELHRKFKDSVEPAIDVAADYRIIYIDTLKHYDSQLAKMLSQNLYTDYVKMSFPAIYSVNGERKSLWPARMPIEFLDKLAKEDPITFAKEYMGDPVTGDSQIFKAEDFRKWSITNNEYLLYDSDGSICGRGELRDCKVAIGYDLAWDDKRRHDYTAVVPCYLTTNNEILIDSYINEKGVKPDMLAEYLFNFDKKYMGITKKVVYHGFEKGKYEKVFKWLLDQEKKKRGHFPIIKDIPWVTDKKERITIPLQPRYNSHAIYHKSGMGDLEGQLLHFPSGTHDDLADSLAIAVRMLIDPPKDVQLKETTQDDQFNKIKKLFMTDTNSRGSFNLNKKSKHFIPSVRSFEVKKYLTTV